MSNYVNLASLQRGTFGTTNNDLARERNDIPLSDNWNVDNYSTTQECAFYIVNFLGLVTVDTLVVRMYEKDNRIFTFHQFESYDGAKWTEILKPGETRKGAFKITFDPRLVSQIRVRGRSTLNDHLHFVRFQAFNISGKASLLIPSSDPPFFQSTGLYNGVMTSDNRDSAWKVIALPGGTSFKAGENAFIQKPHPGWKPAASATAGWIGVTSNGEDGIPVGDYEFQTTFTIPSPYTALEVNFAVDDNLKSVVVSNGTTITSFNGNGFGQWSNFTATGLIPGAVTTMTFKVYNSGGALGLLVQFGAFLVTPPPTSSGIRKL